MLRVYGFPRSGNNLLASYIANTFYPDEDTSVRGVRWGHWSNREYLAVNPHGKCLGSHLRFPDDGVYVLRDPVDVVYSIWRSPGFRHKNDLRGFSEFIRGNVDWKFSPGQRHTQPHTVLDNYHEHRAKSRGKGLDVDFDSVIEEPEAVLNYIGFQCGIKVKQFSKIDEPVGFSPNVGKAKEISAEDIDYIKNYKPK